MNASLATPLLLLTLHVHDPLSPDADPRRAEPGAQEEKTLRQKIQDAMRIGAHDEIVRLIKMNLQESVDEVIRICEAIAVRTSDELEELAAALRKAWKEAYKTDFVDNMYEFFSLMRPDAKEARKELQRRYAVDLARYEEARKKKDADAFPEVGMNFLEYAHGFEQIGDLYNVSQAYMHYGICFDEQSMGYQADLERAYEGLKKAYEAREAIGLKDNFWSDAKDRAKSLEALGLGRSPEERAEAAAADAEANTIVAPAAFVLQEDFDKYDRPMYTLDTAYQLWPTVQLQGPGSEGTFPSFVNGVSSPKILRTAAAKAGVDQDGDGQVDVEIPLTGKITPIQVEVGDGEDRRPWAFLAVIGRTEDTYQGFKFNLEISDNFMSLYTAPAASLSATIGETEIRVFDDNMDGVYGSNPLTWGYIGTIEGSYQPNVDSVLVAGEKVARPWSDLLELGGTWYRLQVVAGREVRALPVETKTGFLELDFDGGGLDWVAVQGTGDNEFAIFGLTQGKKVAVPVGQYRLLAGRISAGKGDQMVKALILPKHDTQFWNVAPDETVDVALGAPFSIDFDFTQDAQTLTVLGKTVVVTGRGNETYQRLWNCVLEPDVWVRRAGSKKGKEEGRMRPIQSQEESVDAGNDYEHIWFPKDFVHEKSSDDTLEVQLSMKKHKLFKKLESDWQAD